VQDVGVHSLLDAFDGADESAGIGDLLEQKTGDGAAAVDIEQAGVEAVEVKATPVVNR
jgi:hypothetical protein